jgi:two-component system, NtrC family, response regulator HydG
MPILLVDDDADLCATLAKFLQSRGHSVQTLGNGRDTLEALAHQTFDLVLLDLHLADMDGLLVLEKIRGQDPDLPVVMLTGDTDVVKAVKAMKMGARDYLTKPCHNDEIALVVERALKERALERKVEVLRERLGRQSADSVLGRSPAMRKTLAEAGRIAPTDLTVILQGESGTGKERLARHIHALSSRQHEDFLAVDCGSLPESLIESELFGHEKGAFTGAHQRKLGLFELALGGTLFLDEIGNMPYATQAKLLRAIQERRIRRVGGSRDIPFEARILVATNVNLAEAVRAGKFREDLYHRLNQFAITLPPLRERLEDVPDLANHFLKEANESLKKQVEGFSERALAVLDAYTWPGNVRELKNVVTRAVLVADRCVEPDHLSLEIRPPENGHPASGPTALKELSRAARAEAEKRLILETLKQLKGNKARAAQTLGINRMTLYLKLKKYNIPH